MTSVLKRSHSVTCTPRVHPLTEWTCYCLPSRSWYSFTDPGGMEGIGLGWLVGYRPYCAFTFIDII